MTYQPDHILHTRPSGIHLTEIELATRWRTSTRTLQRRRRDGHGPAWLRLGRRILYPLDAVEAEEARARFGGETS